MRHFLVLVGIIAATSLTLVPIASGDEKLSCPNGYGEPGLTAVPTTEAQLRSLPRIAAGLDANPAPYTVEELIAQGDNIDQNDDGLFCLKAVSNLKGSGGKNAFFYNAVDNHTGAS